MFSCTIEVELCDAFSALVEEARDKHLPMFLESAGAVVVRVEVWAQRAGPCRQLGGSINLARTCHDIYVVFDVCLR